MPSRDTCHRARRLRSRGLSGRAFNVKSTCNVKSRVPAVRPASCCEGTRRGRESDPPLEHGAVAAGDGDEARTTRDPAQLRHGGRMPCEARQRPVVSALGRGEAREGNAPPRGECHERTPVAVPCKSHLRGAGGAERLRRTGARRTGGRGSRRARGVGRASLRGPSMSSPATGQPSGRVHEAHAAPASAEPQRSRGFHGPRCCFCSSQNRSCSAPHADCPRARRLRRRCGGRAAAAGALLLRACCWGSGLGVERRWGPGGSGSRRPSRGRGSGRGGRRWRRSGRRCGSPGEGRWSAVEGAVSGGAVLSCGRKV